MKSRRHFLQAAGALTAGTLLSKSAAAFNKGISFIGDSRMAGNFRRISIAHTGLTVLPGSLPAHQLLIAPNVHTTDAIAGEIHSVVHQSSLIRSGVISCTLPISENGLPDNAMLEAFCAKAKQLKAEGCQVVAGYINLPMPDRKEMVTANHWTANLHDLDVLFTAETTAHYATFVALDRNRHELVIAPLHDARREMGTLSFSFDEAFSKNNVGSA